MRLKKLLAGLLSLVVSDATSCVSASANDREILYDRDIAPIIRDHCAGCHRPGQSGPFPLLSRNDVIRQAATIEAVVEDGYMPPWKPVHTGIEFANDRRLTPEEKHLIGQWVSQLTSLEQETAQSELLAENQELDNEPSAWALGPPDLIVRMQEPFAVPADGPDVYRSFVLPLSLPEDRWVKAMELRPTARGAVHHALFFIDPDGTARTRRSRDGQPGFSGMSFLSPSGSGFDAIAKNMNRGLGGYVPGATPNRLPGDLARKLPAGSDIVMQTHFHPIGRATYEQAELGLYFAKQPPSQQIIPIQVPALFGIGAGIDIPAGEENHVVTETYKLPIDVEAIEVGGHAHYICKSMQMTATKPDGQRIDLLRIDSWDLDWQDQYQFKHRIALPKGTMLQVQICYDNSASNPSNPYSPPRRIQWGRESNDEMGSIALHVVAKTEADREVLERDIERFTVASIRRRIESRTKTFSRLTGLKPSVNLLLTLFDRNHDGALQRSEIPVAQRNQLLDFFDLDGDQTLSPAELKRARELYTKLMQSDDDSAAAIANLVGTNFGGKQSTFRDAESTIATVIVFVKHDCPIANSYLPTLHRIKEEFQPQGVRFLLVYPSPVVTNEIARKHAEDYAIEIPAFLDRDLAVAEVLDAKVTPEVFVVDPAGIVLYRGRIDDKYVGFGKRRTAPTREDLREALGDVTSKRPVRVSSTKPLGCIIPRHTNP